tara:strand:- start:23 stop:214 length:192 start_codon:yes stop_codon:yes gene_type:complete
MAINIFTEIAQRQIKCEICGSETVALYGGGWDNDRIYCRDKDCGAEYEFPTTTMVDNEENTPD